MTDSDEKEIALDLLTRLLAGERGLLPLHLSMLLERASPLDSGDEFYRWILPPELAKIRLNAVTADEILGVLCAEIARNPDEALISTIAFCGADLATRTAAMLLTNPPRQLTMREYTYVWPIISKFLPWSLKEDAEFITMPDLHRIIQMAREYENLKESEHNLALLREHRKQFAEILDRTSADTGYKPGPDLERLSEIDPLEEVDDGLPDRAERVQIKHFADNFLNCLTNLGISLTPRSAVNDGRIIALRQLDSPILESSKGNS